MIRGRSTIKARQSSSATGRRRRDSFPGETEHHRYCRSGRRNRKRCRITDQVQLSQQLLSPLKIMDKNLDVLIILNMAFDSVIFT